MKILRPDQKRPVQARSNYVNRGVTERFMAGEYDSSPMGNDLWNFVQNVVAKADAQTQQDINTPKQTATTTPKKKTLITTYIMVGLGGIALLGLGVFYMKNRSKKK